MNNVTCNLDINLQSLQSRRDQERGASCLGLEIVSFKNKEKKVYRWSLKHLEHVKSLKEIISLLLE